MTTLRTRAYAKINFGLEVLGRRPDGYHDIVTLVHTISLHDVVECTPADRLSVETEPPVVGEDENLARRAALALAAHVGREPAVHLTIRKTVPLAAGLGGGSSDAAATLRLMQRLWGLREAGLLTVAASIGSDVPLFMRGGSVFVTGRGERLGRSPLDRHFWVALACPRFDVGQKTHALYSALTVDDWSDGRTLSQKSLDARFAGQCPLVGARFHNVFDRAANDVYPGFAELRRELEERADAPLSLTGAGPSLYALFDSQSAAESAAHRMCQSGVPTHVAHSVKDRPKIENVMAE